MSGEQIQFQSQTQSNPFWQYSLALYAADGVKESCLGFQDNYGANVNLLLFCCWLGAQDVVLGRSELIELQVLIASLDNQFVQQIRQLRRRLDDSSDEVAQILRQQLLSAELSAERLVQNQLYQWLQGRFQELKAATVVPKPGVVEGAVANANNVLLYNLNEYLDLIGIELIDNSHGLVRAAKSVNMQTL